MVYSRAIASLFLEWFLASMSSDSESYVEGFSESAVLLLNLSSSLILCLPSMSVLAHMDGLSAARNVQEKTKLLHYGVDKEV